MLDYFYLFTISHCFMETMAALRWGVRNVEHVFENGLQEMWLVNGWLHRRALNTVFLKTRKFLENSHFLQSKASSKVTSCGSSNSLRPPAPPIESNLPLPLPSCYLIGLHVQCVISRPNITPLYSLITSSTLLISLIYIGGAWQTSGDWWTSVQPYRLPTPKKL